MIGQCHLVLLKVEYYRFLELRKAMTSQVSLLLDIWFTSILYTVFGKWIWWAHFLGLLNVSDQIYRDIIAHKNRYFFISQIKPKFILKVQSCVFSPN